MRNLYGVLIIFLASLVISPVSNAQEKGAEGKKVTEEKIIVELQKEKQKEEKKKTEELEEVIERVIVGYPMRPDSIIGYPMWPDSINKFYFDISSEAMREARDAARSAYELQDELADMNQKIRVYTTTGSPYFSGGPGNTSSLQYSRQLDKSSSKSNYTFEIDADARRASIIISGHCSEGEIRIRVNTPDGKLYTEILIDDMGSVNWNKSFNIKGENSDKAGSWNFEIISREATGNFRLALNSN